ncbi:MAG: putative quinol monooxygenase [Gaiellaceae bacterium]
MSKATVTKGLLVRMLAKPGKEADVASFLETGRTLVGDEPATTAWFGIRFDESEFVIFDVFPDDEGRQAHLSGPVGQALQEQGPELLAQSPTIEQVDVLWSKLPG